MPKPLVQDVAREEIALEQLKSGPVKIHSGQQKKVLPIDQKARLEELKRRDAALSRQRVAEIEAEMRELRKVREEELQQRRQQRRQQPEISEEPVKEPVLTSPATKPKWGLFGAGRRIKSAQQKSQPETASRRTGG